jgi:hypothetical protein
VLKSRKYISEDEIDDEFENEISNDQVSKIKQILIIS